MLQGSRLVRLTAGDDRPLACLNDCVQTMVCSMNNARCRLRTLGEQCKECPGTDPLLHQLQSVFSREGIEEVVYRQWQTVDRCNIETITADTDAFIYSFLSVSWKSYALIRSLPKLNQISFEVSKKI
jgi:hypothetical protein